ncbi:MAG: hypothetical protein J0L84_16450, partial [Verrucomicrobia bacterium]|nr:hypothetical protein [Verrucomicrobiota bacterium]
MDPEWSAGRANLPVSRARVELPPRRLAVARTARREPRPTSAAFPSSLILHPSSFPQSLLLAFGLLLGAAPQRLSAATVNFARDVLPLLSDQCFACHGPDAGSRKAGLRLDTPDGA